MYPYLAILAVPGGLALTSPSARRFALLLVALIYFLFVGFRFHVGMDWNNYIDIYESKRSATLPDMIFAREAGYGVLMWVANLTGWGIIFVNAISGLVFCWGFFAVAKQSREPWIAVAIASPLLVVAFAMSATRQALAAGIIFHLMAHWQQRGTIARMLLVIFASLFHFSSIFVMIFVALGARAPGIVRIGGAVLVAGLVVASSGVNPSPTGRAAVACAGAVVATTDAVPFSSAGDAEVDAMVSLPSPCLDLAVFFLNGAGTRWFAVTGI